jgi:hypothetical protein
MKEFIFANLILFFLPLSFADAKESYPGKLRQEIYKTIAQPLTEQMECLTLASTAYKVDEFILLSVLLVEKGYLAPLKKNNNGSYDHGYGQINTVRSSEIAEIGLTLEDVKNDPCKNIIATSHILKNEITESGNVWEGIGNYHYDIKGQWPKNHFAYRQKVFNEYLRIISIAKQHI